MMTCIDEPAGPVRRKGGETGRRTALRSDQGPVYAPEDCSDLLTFNRIIRSMSRSGAPTDNAAMEAINGRLKEEPFADFHITGREKTEIETEKYIKFFNEERPAYALGHMTPKLYREEYMEEMFRND